MEVQASLNDSCPILGHDLDVPRQLTDLALQLNGISIRHIGFCKRINWLRVSGNGHLFRRNKSCSWRKMRRLKPLRFFESASTFYRADDFLSFHVVSLRSSDLVKFQWRWRACVQTWLYKTCSLHGIDIISSPPFLSYRRSKWSVCQICSIRRRHLFIDSGLGLHFR